MITQTWHILSLKDNNKICYYHVISGYGLIQHAMGPTHDAGGTLDVVCTRQDLSAPTINVVDAGLLSAAVDNVYAASAARLRQDNWSSVAIV